MERSRNWLEERLCFRVLFLLNKYEIYCILINWTVKRSFLFCAKCKKNSAWHPHFWFITFEIDKCLNIFCLCESHTDTMRNSTLFMIHRFPCSVSWRRHTIWYFSNHNLHLRCCRNYFRYECASVTLMSQQAPHICLLNSCTKCKGTIPGKCNTLILHQVEPG